MPRVQTHFDPKKRITTVTRLLSSINLGSLPNNEKEMLFSLDCVLGSLGFTPRRKLVNPFNALIISQLRGEGSRVHFGFIIQKSNLGFRVHGVIAYI